MRDGRMVPVDHVRGQILIDVACRCSCIVMLSIHLDRFYFACIRLFYLPFPSYLQLKEAKKQTKGCRRQIFLVAPPFLERDIDAGKRGQVSRCKTRKRGQILNGDQLYFVSRRQKPRQFSHGGQLQRKPKSTPETSPVSPLPRSLDQT